MLPRSLLCSVCHSAGCRRYFLGWGPTLDAIPSSDRLNRIRRLDLAFLRLSTTIDHRSTGLRGNRKCRIPRRYIRPIYYYSDIFCNSDFLPFGSSLMPTVTLVSEEKLCVVVKRRSYPLGDICFLLYFSLSDDSRFKKQFVKQLLHTGNNTRNLSV